MLVVTSHYNNPLLVLIQVQAYRAFYVGSSVLRFVVINDGQGGDYARIEEACRMAGVECVQSINAARGLEGCPSKRNANVLNQVFREIFASHEGPVFSSDGDLMPFAPFDADSFLDGHDIASQKRALSSMWGGCTMLRSGRWAADIDMSCMPGVDCGGASSKFVATTDKCIRWLPSVSSGTALLDMQDKWVEKSKIGSICLGSMFHFGAMSCNWVSVPWSDIEARLREFQKLVIEPYEHERCGPRKQRLVFADDRREGSHHMSRVKRGFFDSRFMLHDGDEVDIHYGACERRRADVVTPKRMRRVASWFIENCVKRIACSDVQVEVRVHEVTGDDVFATQWNYVLRVRIHDELRLPNLTLVPA